MGENRRSLWITSGLDVLCLWIVTNKCSNTQDKVLETGE